MAAHFHDFWLYPAALGVLVLSKALQRAAGGGGPAGPPAALSLTSANSRLSIFGLATAGRPGRRRGRGRQVARLPGWELRATAVVFVVARRARGPAPPPRRRPRGRGAGRRAAHRRIGPVGRRRRDGQRARGDGAAGERGAARARRLPHDLLRVPGAGHGPQRLGGHRGPRRASPPRPGRAASSAPRVGSRLHNASAPTGWCWTRPAPQPAITVLAAIFYSSAMAAVVAGVSAVTNALGKVGARRDHPARGARQPAGLGVRAVGDRAAAGLGGRRRARDRAAADRLARLHRRRGAARRSPSAWCSGACTAASAPRPAPGPDAPDTPGTLSVVRRAAWHRSAPPLLLLALADRLRAARGRAAPTVRVLVGGQQVAVRPTSTASTATGQRYSITPPVLEVPPDTPITLTVPDAVAPHGWGCRCSTSSCEKKIGDVTRPQGQGGVHRDHHVRRRPAGLLPGVVEDKGGPCGALLRRLAGRLHPHRHVPGATTRAPPRPRRAELSPRGRRRRRAAPRRPCATRPVGVPAAAQAVGDVVEQLDQVLDDRDELVGLLPAGGGHRGGHRRQRVEHAHLQGLITAASGDDAELHPLAGLQLRRPGRQGVLVHEDVGAALAGRGSRNPSPG